MSSPVQLQRINSAAISLKQPHHHHSIITRHGLPPSSRAVVNIPDSDFSAVHHSLSTMQATPNQCCSIIIQHINAPLPSVWALVRRFDEPQAYKQFLKSCHVIAGDDPYKVGTLREVHVVSGLPAAFSRERLEILDDERYMLSFSVVGGEHRLNNYRSVTTLHANGDGDGDGTTVVVESYVVDVPAGNTKEETCVFVDTIVRCNLQSLAKIVETSYLVV